MDVKKTIWIVDIEEIPTRYSGQWRKWFPIFFIERGYDVTVIGFDDVIETKPNEFMSFIGSNRYKAKQTQKLATLMDHDMIGEDDIVFFLDAWHPGIIQLKQMSIFYKNKFKIAGFWHAGSYDPHDILGDYPEFHHFEKGVVDCLDYNLFATKFSKKLLEDNLDIHNNKTLHTVGFLYDINHLYEAEKENIIVFPHRIAPEKHPEIFDLLRELLPEYECIKTMEVTSTKDEYHELLSRAKYSVSFAEQETFGISMMESVFSGCLPIVPDELSYKELYLEEFKYEIGTHIFEYETAYAVAEKIKLFDKNSIEAKYLVQEQQKRLKKIVECDKLKDLFQV